MVSFSCENESNDDYKRKIEITKTKKSDLVISNYQKKANLYCVLGDTVLIFRLRDAKIYFDKVKKTRFGKRAISREIWFFYGFSNISKMSQPELYKDYIDIDKYNYTISFDREDLRITNERFSIYDERGEIHTVELYDRYYPALKFRKFDESENAWLRKNDDEIWKWRENPIRSMDTTVSYIDVNKKVCKLSSGYVGKMKSTPELQYVLPNVQRAIFFRIDTISTLGYPETQNTKIDSITILDFRTYKNFDFICVTYKGLEVLAQDLKREIVPTKYSFMLYLKDM